MEKISKSFKIFNWLQKGFSNSFSIVPLLRELYDEIEKLDAEELEELGKKHPKIKGVIEKLKIILTS